MPDIETKPTTDPAAADELADLRFSVVAEVEEHDKPLVLTKLTWGRLIDDVVVPYEADDDFFIDGVPVKRSKLCRIKIVQQRDSFDGLFGELHRYLRHGDLKRQELYGRQYDVRLQALLCECGDDVTSQVIQAYNSKIKPSITEYLTNRAALIRAAFDVFILGLKMLGADGDSSGPDPTP